MEFTGQYDFLDFLAMGQVLGIAAKCKHFLLFKFKMLFDWAFYRSTDALFHVFRFDLTCLFFNENMICIHILDILKPSLYLQL